MKASAVPRDFAAAAAQPGSYKDSAWVTGCGGLIGSWLASKAPEVAPEFDLIALGRNRLDLLDFEAVRRRFAEDRPELVLHCAALSRSPDCEANPELARLLNVEVVQLLVELAAHSRLVFLSTDLVFDGRVGNYDEMAVPNPLGVYAETKLQAEGVVLSGRNNVIIRTSLNGGRSPTGDRGFNEQMRLAWKQGRTLRLFTDEFRSPISAECTARAVWEIARKGSSGIYHVAGSERMSRWEIGKEVAARWPQLQPRIAPASLKEYSGAPRPPDTSLNCGKAQKLLTFALPRFTDWLKAQPAESF